MIECPKCKISFPEPTHIRVPAVMDGKRVTLNLSKKLHEKIMKLADSDDAK